MNFKQARAALLVIILAVVSPVFAAEVDSYSLWQAGVAHSAEQLLLGRHQEVGIEQEIAIAASADSVMAVLADIQHYTDLYPLFDVIELHKIYQSSELEVISEFSAVDRESFGAFVSEDQYFGVSVINDAKKQVVLNIWQLDQVFISIRIVISPQGHNTKINLYTHIQAAEGTLKQMLLHELDMPVLRIDLLKQLLERGFIPEDNPCVSHHGEKRYCF